MEVLNKNVALLSNYEVYNLLKQTKENLTLKLIKKKKIDANTNNLDAHLDKHLPTIVYESLKYLEKSPSAQQSAPMISEFMSQLDERKNEFKLTKIEKLQLLNLRPANAVELQAIIDDSEERFTIEQMDSLLDFVQRSLGSNSHEEIEMKEELNADNQ